MMQLMRIGDSMVGRLTVAFDVDGTLIWEEGHPNHIPETARTNILQLVRSYIRLGVDVYVWSGGGILWSHKWVHELGLGGYVEVVEKGSFVPDIAFDNEDVNLGKINIKV